MGCMKCGKKLGKSQVFCDECLIDMEQNPVKPGSVVKLPKRPAPTPVKKRLSQRYYFWNAEDKIDSLKLRLRWVLAAFIVTFLCLVAAIIALIWVIKAQGQVIFPFPALH